MKKWTLEQLIEIGKQSPRKGDKGIDELKREIKWYLDMCEQQGSKKNIYTTLEWYVNLANTEDLLFNAKQVYSCWELINEIE